MTDLPTSSEDQTGKQGPSDAPEAKPRLGRRFILTGMPFAMTLANRPAFATGGGTCTMSLLASLTNSTPVREDLNCGVSPGCWKQHALDCTNTWESVQTAGISTGTTLNAIFTVPTHVKVVDSNGTVCNPSFLTILSQSSSGFRLKYKGGNSSSSDDDFTTSDAGCLRHIVAGLLNAIAFNGGLTVNGVLVQGHYPVQPSTVISTFNSVLAMQYTGTTAVPQSFKDSVNTALVNAKNLIYQVGPDGQHYCDVDL